MPEISVVIPTYNRCALLHRTLEQLTRQRVAPSRFEVVVADDGSSDATRDVVAAYQNRLRIQYHFQPDQGRRAAAARNAGARLARAPVLAFLDTGGLAGPDFIDGHLAAQAGPGPSPAVIGYVYAYNPLGTCPGLAEALCGHPPSEVVRRFAGVPAFLDVRHVNFAKMGFELSHLAVPWIYFWSANVSVPAGDFWAVGGFDEVYGWGCEDIALGYRLFRRGVPLAASLRAWSIESPHERDTRKDFDDNSRNVDLFLAKYPEPVTEMYWAVARNRIHATVEGEYRNLVAWAAQNRQRTLLAELAELTPAGEKVAVFGSGPAVPAEWPPAVLVDFDRDVLERATAGGPHTGIHGIGIRTGLPDRSVDHVVVTSRLAPLWPRWGDLIRAEAARVGKRVHLPGGA